MSIFESEFMRRARYLPEEKRVFLLDTMEQTRQVMLQASSQLHSTPSHEKQLAIHRKAGMSFQESVCVAYYLLDSRVERSVIGIEKRLEEMHWLLDQHYFKDLYAASEGYRMKRESDLPQWNFSKDGVTFAKQDEYTPLMREYCRMSDADRQRFIKEIQSPLAHYRPHLCNLAGRQREG